MDFAGNRRVNGVLNTIILLAVLGIIGLISWGSIYQAKQRTEQTQILKAFDNLKNEMDVKVHFGDYDGLFRLCHDNFREGFTCGKENPDTLLFGDAQAPFTSFWVKYSKDGRVVASTTVRIVLYPTIQANPLKFEK